MLKNADQLNYIIYARKSSESEDRQVVSVIDQIQEMNIIASSESLHVVDVIEESQSAKEPGRTGFERMVKIVKERKANGILCWDLDRLARNPIDGGVISWLLQTGAIQRIRTYNNEHRTQDNALILQMHFGMATQYVRDLSKNVKRGLRNKALRGWYPGSLPLGYKHVSPKKFGSVEMEIQVDEIMFQHIRSLWDKLLTGQYSIQQIHNHALQVGILSRNRRLIGRQTVYNIFKNEFYAGYFEWENELGVIMRIKGKHVPMVTQEEFAYVQTNFFHGVNWNNKSQTYGEKLHRILSCGECGKSVTMEFKKRIQCTECSRRFSARVADACPRCGYAVKQMVNPHTFEQRYFHCVNRSKGCKAQSITYDALMNAIKLQLLSFDIIPEIIDRFKSEIDQSNTYYFKEEKARFSALQSQLKQAEEKMSNLPTYAYETGMDRKEFQSIKQTLNQKILDASRGIRELEIAQTGWADEVLNAASFLIQGLNRAQQASEHDISVFIKGMCSKIVLSGRKITFDLLLPYKMMETINGKLHELIQSIEPKSTINFQALRTNMDFILASQNSMRAELYSFRKVSLGKSPPHQKKHAIRTPTKTHSF